jgi:hypothetical protein
MDVIQRIEKLLEYREVPPRSRKRSLADACGITYEAVRQWYTGSTENIKHENLIAISKKWRGNLNWLLTGNGPVTVEDYQKNVLASGGGTLLAVEQTVQEAPAEYQASINNKQLLLALLKASQISEDAELLAKEAYDYVDIATLATSLYGEYDMDEHSLDNEIEKLKQKHRKHRAKTG